MKNKENCPNCLGVGEAAVSKKKIETCPTCHGEGSVDQFIADDFINQLNVIGVYGLD